MTTDLHQCLAFVSEIEKLKMVGRQNMVIDGSRQENSAEHSWHIALMAVVLAGHSNFEGLDVAKVVKMLLIHDVVEIDFGDTFLYDVEANKSKAQKETAAARRIFGMLPEGLSLEFLQLWNEFEARETPEAKFAAALDGLQPLMNHLASGGVGIVKHKIATERVIASKSHIAEGSATLWDYAQDVIRQSEVAGLYIASSTSSVMAANNGNPEREL
ncbi:MAG: HD domain-containing protein [Fibrobacterota bacterium]